MENHDGLFAFSSFAEFEERCGFGRSEIEFREEKKVDEIFLSDAKSKNCPLYKDEDKISLFWHCVVQTYMPKTFCKCYKDTKRTWVGMGGG